MEMIEQDEQAQSGGGSGLLAGLLIAGALIGCIAMHPAVPMQTSDATQSSNNTTVSVSSTYQQYVTLAQQDATSVGISPSLFVRQIYKESSFNPNAVSPDGAIGIAQFMPVTAQERGVNPNDVDSSLKGAATWMAQLQQQYGSYDKALAAYNAGPGAMDQANQCGASWESCLPAETQQYISDIEN